MCVCMFAYVGYDVSWNILDTADFGLPQRRRRCYMLAFLSPVRQEASYLRIVSLVILHTCRFVKPFVVYSFC
jgi:site-specific DNA-cytosine methylase